MECYIDTFGDVHFDIDDFYTSGIDKILCRLQMESTEKALNNIKSQVEKDRIKKKRAKLKAYKQRRRERKTSEEKERQIEIQKEAYIRAMKELEK